MAPQPDAGSSPQAHHLNPPDETNRMVYGSRWWHACSCHQVKRSDSSSARGPPGPGSGPLGSAGRDESNGIRLELVACLSLSSGEKE